MRAAIMQPYFFPYIGYISLIKQTDFFILFDTTQFIRHGWIERNRILKPNEGWQYIATPLQKHKSQILIKDIKINNNENWREKILRQLEHYKKRAPFYNDTIDVIKKGISKYTDNIVELNKNTLLAVCEYLNVHANIQVFSDMKLDIDPVCAPDEWALNICKSLQNIGEYWNPMGGITFFDRKKYDKSGIKLHFLKMNLPFYSQRRGPENFEKGLSIIDVMMFNSPEQIREMLDNYELL